jgi:hypothetical protein
VPLRQQARTVDEILAEILERLRQIETRPGVRAARKEIPTTPAGGVIDLDVFWTSPFGSSDYVVTVTAEDITGSMRVLVVVLREAARVTVRLQNAGVGSASGTLHALGVGG